MPDQQHGLSQATDPSHKHGQPSRQHLLLPLLALLLLLLRPASADSDAPLRNQLPPTLPNWASANPYGEGADFTSMRRTDPGYKVYTDLWWHGHRFYAMQPLSAMSASSSSGKGSKKSAGSVSGKANAPASADSSSWTGSGKAKGKGSSILGIQPLEDGLSVNTAVIHSPVTDLEQFTTNMRAGYLPGNTLLIDFPFPAFNDNLGHWAEVMIPVYSMLLDGNWTRLVRGRSKYLDRVLLVNLRREMSSWFTELFSMALAPGRRANQQMPPIIDGGDLEDYDALGWLAFENLVVVQDRYTHPDRLTGFIGFDHGDLWRYDGCERYVNNQMAVGFAEPSHGAALRAAAYSRAEWPQPAPWIQGKPPTLPPQITYIFHHDEYPPVVNTEEVVTMLRQVATQFGLRARPVSLSTDAPFASYVATFAESAVVVGRHGPLFANALFLPPGAMVLELLPYKWEWQSVSQLYRNMTRSLGDIHHFAWRPLTKEWCEYVEPQDARYAPWLPAECHARECLLVHAKAGLRVDVDAVRAILLDKLPGVLAGKRVDELREPWPPAA